MSVSERSHKSDIQSHVSMLSSRRPSAASVLSADRRSEDVKAMSAALSRTGSHLSALRTLGPVTKSPTGTPAGSVEDEGSLRSVPRDLDERASELYEEEAREYGDVEHSTPLWPAEPPTSVPELGMHGGPTGNYLYDFYSKLLRDVQEDAQDTLQRLIFQEMELRKRFYSLANADMFRVRFLEEARWELRERHEVIARREKLERSRLEKEMLEIIREQMIGAGGSWSEDAQRSCIEQEEEKQWRKLIDVHRQALKQQDEIEWEAYLAAEDKWRWDVELAVRHGMHQIQLDEHRHRCYLETELYPTNLNKLMHAMELEWLELLRNQSACFHHLMGSSITRILKEEEDHRSKLLRRNKRIVSEFYTLQQLLELQHLEERERTMLEDTADRLFSILYSRESMQLRVIRDRTRETMAQVLAERSSVSHSQVVWGGEVYPDMVRTPPSVPAVSPQSSKDMGLHTMSSASSRLEMSMPVYQNSVPRADLEAAAALLSC